jgi:predicted outer membrane protein
MNHSNRRNFLKTSVCGTLAVGIGLAAASHLEAADDEKVSTPDDKKDVTSEELFRLGVIGPAELSLAACKIAVNKATNKNTKEFTGFELTEAIAVTTVLKDLGTPVPEMDAKAKATLAKLESAEKGQAFDQAFIMAQLENHEFLRDLATNYLKETSGKTDMAEKHVRNLATLALAVFKEHVAITERISQELMG